MDDDDSGDEEMVGGDTEVAPSFAGELPSFSFTRVVHADGADVAVAPFPTTNEHEPRAAVKSPERPEAPVRRPRDIPDAFTGEWYDKIIEWLCKAKFYEIAGRGRNGSGSRADKSSDDKSSARISRIGRERPTPSPLRRA